MTSTIQKFLKKLEDPNRPWLGPNVKWLELWGLLLPQSKFKKLMYMTIHTLMFIFILTEFVEIWLKRSDVTVILQNVKYAMVSVVNFNKVVSFIVWQKYWKSIIEFVSEIDLERRKSQDRVYQDIIRKYTRYCRTITYWYWFLTYCTVAMTISQPLVKYLINLYNGKDSNIVPEVVNSWLPVDKQTLSGYLILISYQIWAVFYSGGWMTSFDTNAFSIMIFFQCEIELLRKDGQFLFGTQDRPTTKEEAKMRFAHCSKRHDDLLRYSRLFDSCLSPIMFLYVIVCSVSLCATSYQITIETNTMQRLITAEYFIFGLAQVFMYCWHSNNVLYASNELKIGPYESIWWTRDVSESKSVNILINQFNKSIVFSAGPFTDMNVATFISILKGAYSYYTLLSQSQEDI